MKRTTLAFFILVFASSFSCESQKPLADCIDPERISSGPCTLDYVPVCGCDGKTYGNACAADRAGVKSWTEGACKGD